MLFTQAWSEAHSPSACLRLPSSVLLGLPWARSVSLICVCSHTMFFINLNSTRKSFFSTNDIESQCPRIFCECLVFVHLYICTFVSTFIKIRVWHQFSMIIHLTKICPLDSHLTEKCASTSVVSRRKTAKLNVFSALHFPQRLATCYAFLSCPTSSGFCGSLWG